MTKRHSENQSISFVTFCSKDMKIVLDCYVSSQPNHGMDSPSSVVTWQRPSHWLYIYTTLIYYYLLQKNI